MALFILSFVAGLLTVLAPCILPLLPVVIGGAARDARDFRKPLTIVLALGASVFLFTLLLKATTALIVIPASFWVYFSGGILILVGLFMLFPQVWERLPFQAKLHQVGNKALGAGNRQKGFWGDVTIGAALGPVFSTCSPTYFVVVGVVLPANFAQGILYLLAFVAGLSLVLLLVAFLGQKVVDRLGGAADPKGYVKRGVGLLLVLVGVLIMFGLDKQIETVLLDAGILNFTQFEQGLLDSIGQ
jgi:cytochrome c-type biogenesis protein